MAHCGEEACCNHNNSNRIVEEPSPHQGKRLGVRNRHFVMRHLIDRIDPWPEERGCRKPDECKCADGADQTQPSHGRIDKGMILLRVRDGDVAHIA
jgi:hypothetical protein